MTYVAVRGLGDATTAAASAASAASACAAYAQDLARWQAEQKAYQSAVASRAATMAQNQAMYQAALKSYNATVAGQAAGYARAAAVVIAKYKAMGFTPPSGMPNCVSQADHDKASIACYQLSNPIKGLGAFNWSSLPACFVSELPVCQPMPVKPTPPATPPAIAPLRAMPVAPSNCTTTAATSVAPPVTVAPVVTPAPLAPPVVEASMASQTKSSAGLLVVAILGAGAIGYLLLKKKKPAA